MSRYSKAQVAEQQAALQRHTWTRGDADTLQIARCLRLKLRKQYVPHIISSVLSLADLWPQHHVSVSGPMDAWLKFHYYLYTDTLTAPVLRIRATANAWSRRGGSMESPSDRSVTIWALVSCPASAKPPLDLAIGTSQNPDAFEARGLTTQPKPQALFEYQDGRCVHVKYVENPTPWTVEADANAKDAEELLSFALSQCKAGDVLQMQMRGSGSLHNHCENASLTVWLRPGFDIIGDTRLWANGPEHDI